MNAKTRHVYLLSLQTQRGLSLVELMVAMTIGFFLLAGVVSLLGASKQSYRASEAMSRVQENGRYAIEFLSRDIRLAGYRDITPTTMGPLADAVRGWNGATSDPSGLSLSRYLSGTDVLSIRYIQPSSSPVVDRIVTYYIAADTGAEPGLRQRTADTVSGTTTTTTQELISGVYDMQVLYGLDTSSPQDGQLDSYTATPSDWNQVIAVRINLLLGSENQVGESAMSLPVLFRKNDGTAFSAASNDRRIYQTFSATIGLRNRLL